MNDAQRYHALQEAQEKHWESLCGHCGACCGALDGDPCAHLETLDNGRYSCTIYENRFGLRRTRSGRAFWCVPIRDILHKSWLGDDCCGYKKNIRKENR